MSEGDEVTYIYEPLFEVTFNGIKIENLEDMEIVEKYLNDLFHCEIFYEKRKKEHKGRYLKKKLETENDPLWSLIPSITLGAIFRNSFSWKADIFVKI